MIVSRPGMTTVLWVGCLLGAFTMTHLPPPNEPQPDPFNDKVLHIIGFAVLGLATGRRFARGTRSRPGEMYLLLFVGLGVYALFDELTQPIVGRSCEMTDWLADLCGALIGLAVVRGQHILHSPEAEVD